MAQDNSTAETKKNITIESTIAEEKVTPKRRGRPKKNSQAQPVTTDVAALVIEAEPTKAAVGIPLPAVSETSTAPFGDDDEVNDVSAFNKFSRPGGPGGPSEPATVASGETNPVDRPSETPSKRHYPTITERLAAADANIARLTQLNESRATLFAKTQTTLEERRTALEKSMKALKTALEKKDRLTEIQNRPSKPPRLPKPPLLSPEARAAARLTALEHARAARKAKKDARLAEEAKILELVEKLRASGRSVEELIEKLGFS